MPMVLIAANASGIMQETKVGKEMILIVIEAFKRWDVHSKVGIQNLKDVFTKCNHASQCLSFMICRSYPQNMMVQRVLSVVIHLSCICLASCSLCI